MFVANIEEMQLRDNQVSETRKQRAERRGESDDDDDENEAAEGSEVPKVASDDNHISAIEKMAESRKVSAVASVPEPEGEQTVFRGLLGGISTANPNEKAANAKSVKVKDLDDGEIVDQEAVMSRREREALEDQRRREDYQRRHLAGETEAAKADLARLALVRKRREEQLKKAQAEGRAPAMSANGIDSSSDDSSDVDTPKKKAVPISTSVVSAGVGGLSLSEKEAKKRAAALEDSSAATSAGPAKLKAIDIKKMNGDALKDALKERDLSVQGPKKDLMQRLIDHEASRS